MRKKKPTCCIKGTYVNKDNFVISAYRHEINRQKANSSPLHCECDCKLLPGYPTLLQRTSIRGSSSKRLAADLATS